jgi:hypothetical protein
MKSDQDGNNTLTYVLPDVIDPPDTICVTLRIPNNKFHIMAFRGAVWDLCNWWNWEKDDAHNATKVAQVWRRVFRGMKFDECPGPVAPGRDGMEIDDMTGLIEPYCDDQGNCRFHFRCDICGSWHDVATINDLKQITSPGPVQNQPQPGGGTQQTCQTLWANAQLPIPSTVSTGDQITLNSAAGSWWDGGEFDFGPLWRLPNGNQYVGGLDVGFPRVTGTDPAVAADHMTVIAVIGATPTYLALIEGTPVTVPSIAPGSQLFLQVNDSAIGNNQGSAQVCVTVKNNATPSWCHTFDFTSSPSGWVPVVFSSDDAAWVTGAGWTVGTNSGQEILIKKVLTSAVYIVSIEVFLASALSGINPYMECVADATNLSAPSTAISHLFSVNATLSTQIEAGANTDYGAGPVSAPPPNVVKIIICGTGVDPF